MELSGTVAPSAAHRRRQTGPLVALAREAKSAPLRSSSHARPILKTRSPLFHSYRDISRNKNDALLLARLTQKAGCSWRVEQSRNTTRMASSGARHDEIVATPEPGVYYVNGQTWSVRLCALPASSGALWGLGEEQGD